MEWLVVERLPMSRLSFESLAMEGYLRKDRKAGYGNASCGKPTYGRLSLKDCLWKAAHKKAVCVNAGYIKLVSRKSGYGETGYGKAGHVKVLYGRFWRWKSSLWTGWQLKVLAMERLAIKRLSLVGWLWKVGYGSSSF